MKKHLLSAAVLLGLASGATSAVTLSDTGVGEVLLYPYYSVNNGKDTYFNVVNTTNEYKAVKVRLNEAANSWEVLDFNVYLSPYDIFSAAITLVGDVPTIISNDNSCIQDPGALKNGIALRSTNITGFKDVENEGGDISFFDKLEVQDRLREGHIEVIEMGVVTNPTWQKYILHDQTSGMPGDCNALADDLRTATPYDGDLISLSDDPAALTFGSPEELATTPTGGLFGDLQIIDVDNGSSASVNATAITGFLNGPVHVDAGTSFPNLNGNFDFTDATRVRANLDANITIWDSAAKTNTIINPTYANPVQALGAVLMASEVYNFYDAFDGTQSGTDWVITFPTKHAHVNESTHSNFGHIGLADYSASGADKYLAPFKSGKCTSINLQIWNTEEGNDISTDDFSPRDKVAGQSLCYETNVIEFKAERSVLQSKFANQVSVPFNNGWAKLTFNGTEMADSAATAGNTLVGLPVTGFSISEVQNNFLGDNATIRANYGKANTHRYRRQAK